MQRYLEQLYSDIENAHSRIKKNSIHNESDDDLDFIGQIKMPTQTSEILKLSQLTGLAKCLFPSTNQLTEDQKNTLGIRLEELLWSCNFIIVVPIVFTHAQRYSFIREIWNNTYKINKGGLFIAELYRL